MSIPCAANGFPKPTIKWYKIGNQSVLFGPELSFASIEQQDAGYYECRASNGVEKDLVSGIELKVLGKYIN